MTTHIGTYATPIVLDAVRIKRGALLIAGLVRRNQHTKYMIMSIRIYFALVALAFVAEVRSVCLAAG